MKTKKKKFGFTIVELLTVMAVIAMLLGILVPALNLVRKLAKDTNQKAQFHGIDVGIETYGNENDGQYPESRPLPNYAPTVANEQTVGAQRLAEALIGRDMLGFDPNTSWDADFDHLLKDRYASTKSPKVSSLAQVDASLNRRQGPYLKVERTDAFQVGELYTDSIGAGLVYDGITYPSSPAPVLTDTYRVKKVVRSGKNVMAGTPILYYKANINTKLFPDTTVAPFASAVPDPNAEGSIYVSSDNERLIYLGTVKDQAIRHRFDHSTPALVPEGRWFFYSTITNKQIVSQARPFNSDSYILMSAGADGIYGTRDDIYNFE
jgi:prepilin-type N-terminal cleavage/methylation domain-containing protein